MADDPDIQPAARQRGRTATGRPVWHWIVLAIAVVLLVAVLGLALVN